MFSVALDVFFVCKPLQLKKLWQSKELWNMPYLVAIAMGVNILAGNLLHFGVAFF
jgi:hypothetical protein